MTLSEFFGEHKKAAIAFSGGVDSSYLLYEAVAGGADVCAYYVNTPFQPAFELEDAKRVAAYVNARMKIIEADILSREEVVANPQDRCYYCKQRIFGTILKAASADGFSEVWDGTNASDDEADRPGMRALKELQVLSPLRICSLTKDEIRMRSKEAGLFTWNKPAYACLATRIPNGMRITKENLARTEQAEEMLFRLGFSDFRVRTTKEGGALVQIREAQVALLEETRTKIAKALDALYAGVSFGWR